jgi:SNF2 family DNA or RNA helicase
MRPWTPHKYQKKALKFLLERPNAALFLDPGLGKTSISYAAISVLKKQKMLKGALVVAPRRPAVSTWPQEHAEWEDFQHLKICVLHGAGKEQSVRERADVYVCTHEGLRWMIREGHLQEMLRKKWLDTLFLDELHKFKHTETKRFKEFEPYIRRFTRRYGLTGSPAANGLMDLFGQAYVLDAGKALGVYSTHFKFTFFMPSDPNSDYPTMIPKPGAKELIFERMKDLAIRMDARDLIEMPQISFNYIKLDMSDELRKTYESMEEEMFAELEGMEVVTAATAAAVSMKCRQITSGAIYRDKVDPVTGIPRQGKREWRPVHDEKLEAMADLIEELQGEQLLVAYEFGHERDRMVAKFGKDLPVIGGGTSDKKALEYERAWNAGELPLLVAHPQSMSHGLNFQKSHARHILFFSGTWDYENYDQFIRRLMRQGNKADRITVHQLVYRKTVDEAVVLSNKRKQRDQDEFHAALNTYKKSRKTGSLL